MHIILNKVLTSIVVWQMSDVILIHYLQIHLFTQQATKEWFFGRLYILATVIFVLNLGAHATHSHIHTRMPSFKTVHDAQTNITLGAKIVCSLFCSSLHTHGNDVVSLLRANAGNVSLPGDLFGIQMDSVSLQICHLQSHFARWIP